jgi:ABC-type uncharacterized transport system permease subunit
MRPLAAPLSLPDLLRGYVSLLNRSLRANFAYRATTVMALATAALSYAVTIMVWRRVYAENPGNLAVPREEMFAYLALAFCMNFAVTINVEMRVGQRIRMGLIATDLLKPVDFQTAQAFQSVADGIFNATLGACVFASTWILLGDSVLPAGGTALAGFAVSVLLAFLLQYGISFLFVQGAFYTNSGYGIFASRVAMHQTFSGVAAPLALYPPFLKTLGAWLPFQHVIHTPIGIYNGTLAGPAMFAALGRQALWIAGLFLAGRLIMGHALRQFEVQGG